MTALEPTYSLNQAVAKFWPDGPLTISTLRTAIRHGRLCAYKVEGKLLVTETALTDWLQSCRVAVNLPDCGLNQPTAGERRPGTSLTERNASALDAAKVTLDRLNASSPTTSGRSSRRR